MLKIKKSLTNNIGLKIISIIFAIMLWLVVININDPTRTITVSGIPVTILNDNVITDNNEVYNITQGKTATISVTGPQSIVYKLSASDFTAEADLKDLSQTNATPIEVELKDTKYANKITIDKKTKMMRIEIENIVSKDFDVSVKYNGKVEDSYALGDYTLSYSQVNIVAPQSVVDNIEKVQVDYDVNDLKTNLNADSVIRLYDKNGKEIEIDTTVMKIDHMVINIQAPILRVKEVELKFNKTGTPAEGYEYVGINCSVTTVKIIGKQEALDNITQIEVPKEMIDISNATADVVIKLNLSEILPNGVYIYSEDEKEIEITAVIENLVGKNITISKSSIEVRNIPTGCKAEFADNEDIIIRVIGAQDIIDTVTAGSLHAYVDLKGYQIGTSSVTINVTLPSGAEVSGKVNVNIIIVEQNTNTETTIKDTEANTDETTTVETESSTEN